MHILLALSLLLLVIFEGGTLLLRRLPTLGEWSHRQVRQLLVLALPLSCLGLVGGGLIHVIAAHCAVNALWWDHPMDVALLTVLAAILLVAMLLGGLRLMLMKRLMRQRELLLDSDLQARVDGWTQRRGMSPVRVRLCLDTRPLALIYGIRRPTALLSTWMLER